MRVLCILWFYRGNGKENGNYHSILGLYTVGIMEKKMGSLAFLLVDLRCGARGAYTPPTSVVERPKSLEFRVWACA